ncbi:hypothetical protein RJ55_01114 [Drechmeria coniospora]|nr:hypothetical protein RJ55_01114 [Drechmeria coniospora]
MTPEEDPDIAAGTEPLACVSCRARKLKCDRTKPACARCLKLSIECVYPESRRKPMVKRRNVKELEARLAQVEEYLNHVSHANNVGHVPRDAKDAENASRMPSLSEESPLQMDDVTFLDGPSSHLTDSQPQPRPRPQGHTPSAGQSRQSFEMPLPQPDTFLGGGELMGLGYSEATPPFEVQEELNNIFFLLHHHFIPVVHSGRYYHAFYGGPLRKPPMCLQYAIWAIAANGHSKYDQYAHVFYMRARQYAEADEMKGHGEHFISIAHAQTWGIVAAFEAKCMLFTRASMSCAKTVRLCHMMGLDRLDGPSDDLPPALAAASSWTELEERRRVFWGAFAIDSHASISTGWPCLIDTNTIMTRLPASEEAFSSGQEEVAPFMEEAFKGASYSGFAGSIIICQVFREILRHVHRSKPADRADDMMDGAYWKRHRDLDNKLSSAFMFLPEEFRLPQSSRYPPAIHTNLNLHAAVITLHHAAIEMQEKHGLPDSVKQSSKCRLRTSAEEIVNIIKLTSHSTTIFKSPLCALSMYCATTVYVYIAKDDAQTRLSTPDISNLELIISAMEAISRQHEVTQNFLQQTCLDVERNGLDSCIRLPSLQKYRTIFGGARSNIPIITRSAISKHTELSPVLPGRLPLSNPQGRTLPEHLRMEKCGPPISAGGDGEPGRKDLGHSDCFQSFLGAVRRNVAPRPTDNPSKRKRMSPSPGPEPTVNMAMLNAVTGKSAPNGGANSLNTVSPTNADFGGPGSWQFDGGNCRIPQANAFLVLPDRTSSSASSPANREQGTDNLSGSSRSSHTSPGTLGLGNTPEENRVDLRPFQDRIVTPLWPPSAEEVFFAAQIPQSLTDLAPGDEDGAWALLSESMGWQSNNPAGM